MADGLLIQPLIGSLPNIMAPEWFDGLKRAAEGRRLMVLDTLRRFHIEEENASGPMAQVIGRMEAIAADTGCSIVFLHHASKGAAMMGAGDQQQASRGSSVLVDNIRWQSYLSSMTSAEAEEWGVILLCVKSIFALCVCISRKLCFRLAVIVPIELCFFVLKIA